MNSPKTLLLGAVAILGSFATASALSVYYPGEETYRGRDRGRDRGHDRSDRGRGDVVILRTAPVLERHRDRVIVVEPKYKRHHPDRVIIVKKPASVYAHRPYKAKKSKVIIIEERHRRAY